MSESQPALLASLSSVAESAKSSRTPEIKNRRVRRLAALIGLVAISGLGSLTNSGDKANAVPIGLKQSGGLEFVAVNENRAWAADLSSAENVMARIAEDGFNMNRIFLPIDPGAAYVNRQPENPNNVDRTCNAEIAGLENGVQVMLATWGQRKDNENYKAGEIGFFPDTASAQQKFGDVIGSYIWNLYGPNGCVTEFLDHNPRYEQPTTMYVGILNELNSKKWMPYEPNEAASRYVNLLATVYDKLKLEASKFDIDLQVVAGDLASNHNPLAFIQYMGEAIRESGNSGPIFDVWAQHTYGKTNNESPSVVHSEDFVGFADYPRLAAGLKKAFGKTPNIFYDEFGTETSIPNSKATEYKGASPVSIPLISEETQAQFYISALKQSVCYHRVKMVGFFPLYDEYNLSRLQSGLKYYDGTSKSSEVPVSQAVKAALSDELATCSN